MTNSHSYSELYQLQDEVLGVITELNLPFYLTGGTALSRYYLHHRYSDDLDLFINNDHRFKDYVELIERELNQGLYSYEVVTRSLDFVRLNIIREGEISPLKVDLVNDIEYHYGDFEYSKQLGRVDNIMNILSNKVCAIPRLEIKDFVDVCYICQKIDFNWKQVLDDALKKDTWVNPLDLSNYFAAVDGNLLERINWIKRPDFEDISANFDRIADDILFGTQNSLFLLTTDYTDSTE